jgi:REP element-mobilizing transposase RayT
VFATDTPSHIGRTPLLAGRHHARFIAGDVPLHVISRVFQGRHLLRPCDELNAIILGVVGRALRRYADVRLYAMAFLSNHAHFMLQGPPNQVPPFIGFIKREISRRWGRHASVGWRGTMWHEYRATALPTSESQVRCLKYILSQGVKEGLVARPEEWPGVHCARALLHDEPLHGTWLNATTYSRAIDSQSRRRSPRVVPRREHLIGYAVQFAPIPAWQHLRADERRTEVRRLVEEIVVEGQDARAGRSPMGPRRIRRVALEHRTAFPDVPWLQRRRQIICWASTHAPATQRYLEAYWNFQRRFRDAAIEDARCRASVFPPGSYAPGKWTPAPDRLPAAA